LGLVVFLITGYILRDAFFIPKTEAILVALPSIILTVFVTFSFSLCLGMIAFWTTHTSAIDSAFWMGRLFVGGQVIPISFFPGLYQNLINILPFRYTYSFAIEILTGKLNQNEIIYGYFVQISWLVLFLFLYKFMWYRGRKTYTSFGQ
jgi:ABC-2 type transport system permease protein